jgi:hypothetical protein
MASSREAFARFDRWKNSRTVLNLMVVNIVDDECSEDRFQGAIFFADEDEGIVAFVDDESRNHLQLDLSEASFTVASRSVEAKCLDRGTVTFVEVLLV